VPTAPGLDAAAWAALALALTLVGAVLTFFTWRRRGVAAGLRGAAWTLVPLALWLTGTLRLVVRIVEVVASWAVHLVFSPVVWLGLGIAAVAAVLFVVSGRLRPRRSEPAARKEVAKPARGKEVDPEMAEIEAILKRHGI
jgi:peptidoglycan biosynthesis protein MviN/MurJ (putative lipid II flippase)